MQHDEKIARPRNEGMRRYCRALRRVRVRVPEPRILDRMELIWNRTMFYIMAGLTIAVLSAQTYHALRAMRHSNDTREAQQREIRPLPTPAPRCRACEPVKEYKV